MNTNVSVTKTAHDVFQRAIQFGIRPTMWDCWLDFIHWEKARNFGDDPSYPSKAAIDWIDALDDLRSGLEDFEGSATADCLAELNNASISFAKINHSDELVQAIEKWIEYRRSD